MSLSTLAIFAMATTHSGSAASLANAHVWQTLKIAATSGTPVVAPTGELSGLASLVASGYGVPEKAAQKVGSDSATAAALFGSLRQKDKDATLAGIVSGSESSYWFSDAARRDSILQSDYGVEMRSTKPASMKQDLVDWLDDRIAYTGVTAAPSVPRLLLNATQYYVPPSVGLIPSGKMTFAGQKVAGQKAVADYSLDDEAAQIAIVQLAKNRSLALIFALPKGDRTPADVVGHLGEKWDEILAGAQKGTVEVTLPVFSQTVDRDISEWLGLKESGAPGSRERLFVGIGLEPPPPPKPSTARGTAGTGGNRIWMPVWHPQPGLMAPIPGVGSRNTKQKPPPTLLLDRPFVYALADTTSGQVIFAGICVKP